MRRRPRASHANHERWLVSYADFITLLFAFFVVLYSSAQVDRRKVGKLAMAIQVAFQEMGVFPVSSTRIPVDSSEPLPFNTVQAVENKEHSAALGRLVSAPDGALSGASENGDLRSLRQELERELAPEISKKELAIRRDTDGVVISLSELGFFDSGSADIKATSRQTFGRIADLLARRNCRLRIEGHTDNVPIHNPHFDSNWELSTARATGLIRLLITTYGYTPGQLSAAGYAEFHSVASNDTPEGRSLNRRVDIVILGKARAPITSADEVHR